MSCSAAPTQVDLECRRFARFLVGTEPSSYVIESYSRLHATTASSDARISPLVERALLTAAMWGSLPLRIADAYARFFHPRALLRRRLILLLAVLENSPGTESYLGTSVIGSRASVMLRLLGTGAASTVCLMLGILCFGPVHLVDHAIGRQPESCT